MELKIIVKFCCRLKITRTWSVWLVSMELLNLLHVTFQIWLINNFLNGHFIGLGTRIMSYRNWEHGIADPLETVFPKVRKFMNSNIFLYKITITK